MSNKQLYQPFELYVADMEHWNTRPLTYQFFEIVQIMEGQGTREVNNHKYPYHKGSIFLFTPVDCRGFESTTPTRFCSIRFSEVFLEQYKSEQEKARITHWLKQLENIFTHHNRVEQLLIRRDSDCDMISSLITNMIEEYTHRQSYYTENLQHMVTLVLNIISRNVSPEDTLPSDTGLEEPVINKMLTFIHLNIYQPERLRLKHLAAQFNLSEHYIGEYFKKSTGSNLQVILPNTSSGSSSNACSTAITRWAVSPMNWDSPMRATSADISANTPALPRRNTESNANSHKPGHHHVNPRIAGNLRYRQTKRPSPRCLYRVADKKPNPTACRYRSYPAHRASHRLRPKALRKRATPRLPPDATV